MNWKALATVALTLGIGGLSDAATVQCHDCWNESCLDVREYRKPKCGADSVPVPKPPAAVVSSTRCPAGMALVPGGSFVMLNRPERVVVDELCIDVTEVTVAAYAECMRRGLCGAASTTVAWPGITPELRATASAFCNGNRPDRQDHPLNCVDWYQADGFCRARHRRLLTEEEWEWAARGGVKGTRYPWGMADPSDQLCWDRAGDDPQGTCPVSAFPAGDSPQGLHDLAGNVSEWTSSLFSTGSRDRVNRGGGWHIDNPSYVRATDRSSNHPRFRDFFLGFRCARRPRELVAK